MLVIHMCAALFKDDEYTFMVVGLLLLAIFKNILPYVMHYVSRTLFPLLHCISNEVKSY
jgi:hypothetical protein